MPTVTGTPACDSREGSGKLKVVKNPVVTYAEYLAREAEIEVRHEFLRGDVWAMAGGTPTHARAVRLGLRGDSKQAHREAVRAVFV